MLCDSDDSSSDSDGGDEQQQQQPRSFQFKVVLLGDAGAGKTCIMRRLVHGAFSAE